jgi:hypothetical protein
VGGSFHETFGYYLSSFFIGKVTLQAYYDALLRIFPKSTNAYIF